MEANKRDYAVDKLGDDRSAYHSGNESVLANGRVGAVPLLLSASTSACGRGAFQKHESPCGRSENNSTRALGETRPSDKKCFLCALIYIDIFSPIFSRVRTEVNLVLDFIKKKLIIVVCTSFVSHLLSQRIRKYG